MYSGNGQGRKLKFNLYRFLRDLISKELEKNRLPPPRIYISLFLEHRYGNGFPSIAANDTTRNDRFQLANREMK